LEPHQTAVNQRGSKNLQTFRKSPNRGPEWQDRKKRVWLRRKKGGQNSGQGGHTKKVENKTRIKFASTPARVGSGGGGGIDGRERLTNAARMCQPRGFENVRKNAWGPPVGTDQNPSPTWPGFPIGNRPKKAGPRALVKPPNPDGGVV